MRLKSFRDMNKIAVGIGSIMVVGAMVATAFAIGTLGLFANNYEVTAVFSDTGGLKSGQKVRMSGIEVGKVTNVEPDFNAGQILVTFEVDKGVKLGPKTTRVEVAITTLLGGQYLRITGTPEPDDQGRFLEDLPESERRLGLDRTAVPYTIISAVGDATAQIKQLKVEPINKVLASLADIVSTNSATVSDLVTNLTTVVTAINERQADLDQLLSNAQQVSSTLASRDQQVLALVDQAANLLDVLAARKDDLAAVLGNGSTAVTTLADLIESKRAVLDNILNDLHTVLGRVDVNLDAINATLSYTGPTFTLLGAALDEKWINVGGEGLGLVNIELARLILCSVLKLPTKECTG